MIHKGEKPFQCEICKKQFREKSNYNYHLKKHDNLLNKKKEKNSNDSYISKAKTIRKQSDNFTTTKSNTNNSFEKISEDEIFDNAKGQKNQSFCINQQCNINNNNINILDLDNKKNQNTTKSFDFGNKEDIKIFDEKHINCNINTNFNNNPFLKDYSHCFQSKNLFNEEFDISKEKENYFNNIDDLSFSKEGYNNFSLDNDLNLELNSKEFNDNFFSSDIKFNFENTFLKDIIN